MRKLTLILLAMLGVVFFNSCKEDTIEEKPHTTTNILNELKGYTGKTFEQVAATMLSKGYDVIESEEAEGFSYHIFSNANSTTTYNFLEYQNLICIVSYDMINGNRDLLLNNFEKNSQSAVAFIGNTTSMYEGSIELEDSMEGSEDFELRNNFLTYYNQNKNTVSFCSENWTNQEYMIGSEFDFYNDDEYENYSLIGYGDMTLMPPLFDKSNKSIFEMLHRKRR